jgi:hypothetical protein
MRPSDNQPLVTAYTSNFYYPFYPGSNPISWADWWFSPDSFECLPITRPNTNSSFVDPFFMYYRDYEISTQIEFLVTSRCQPGFKKEVDGVVVGVMPQNQWKAYSMQLTKEFPSFKHSERKKWVPLRDDLLPAFYQTPNYTIERYEWTGMNIPAMRTEYWFIMKWLSSTGVPFRANINSFQLVHDSFTSVVKVHFEYTTEFWNEKQWVQI